MAVNVGEIEWMCDMRLTDAGRMSEFATGRGATPEEALDALERELARQADELDGRLERVRELRRRVPVVAPRP